jgi:hypothetical protein
MHPWILVDDGVLVNLNYVIKIIRIDTVAPSYGICFFHTSAGISSGNPSGTQKATYTTQAVADEKFNQIVDLMSATDVRFADVRE